MIDQTEGTATPAMRHKARHFALQAVYQWQMTGDNPTEIERQFREDQPIQGADLDYMHDLISGVITNIAQIDETFSPYLSRPLDDLDEVDEVFC